MQEHKKNIDSAVTQALANAGVTMSEISGVGVTQGPGLEVCLRVGVRKAQVCNSSLHIPDLLFFIIFFV